MAVEIERFDVDAEDQKTMGRPRVACFREPKKGQIDVRVQRDDGSLWLWGIGPSGGDRGRVAFGLNRAGTVLDFANSITATDSRYGVGPALGGGGFSLRVRRPWKERAVDMETTDRLVSVTKGMSMNPFSLRFDAAALDELRTLLREWAATARVQTEEPPVAGEFFARGATPGGTREQIIAWLRAGPEGQLVQIVEVGVDAVRYASVKRGHTSVGPHADPVLGGLIESPLVEFYGEGWRRVG